MPASSAWCRLLPRRSAPEFFRHELVTALGVVLGDWWERAEAGQRFHREEHVARLIARCAMNPVAPAAKAEGGKERTMWTPGGSGRQFVLLTKSTDELSRTRAWEYGVDGVFIEPLDLHALRGFCKLLVEPLPVDAHRSSSIHWESMHHGGGYEDPRRQFADEISRKTFRVTS